MKKAIFTLFAILCSSSALAGEDSDSLKNKKLKTNNELMQMSCMKFKRDLPKLAANTHKIADYEKDSDELKMALYITEIALLKATSCMD
ncbi:hypothetical protein [Shewanella algicola]|uniref:hypothetical protein n=1 Tax=Shewanella algicola TaxID=640633 RepID=UPI00249585F2|nr:hypothetical protein [Shewanella algicola]